MTAKIIPFPKGEITTMTTLKMSDITVAWPLLQELGRQTFSNKVAYNISRNMRLVRQQFEKYQNDRGALIRKYGTPDKKNPSQYSFNPKDTDKMNKELNKINDSSVKLNIRPIKVADMGDKVRPDMLDVLGFMISG